MEHVAHGYYFLCAVVIGDGSGWSYLARRTKHKIMVKVLGTVIAILFIAWVLQTVYKAGMKHYKNKNRKGKI